MPAYFELIQNWLEPGGEPLTAVRLATELILKLIYQAWDETGAAPHGVILPECALSTELAGQLAEALAGAGIDFLITGSLDMIDGKHKNRALTFVYQEDGRITMDDQNKHHRWRLDRGQTERYALDFDPTTRTTSGGRISTSTSASCRFSACVRTCRWRP